MSNSELSILFFLQLAVILAAVRLVGLLARKIGQPQVVGEMIAGVLLGPSLFGALFPGAGAYLFPAQSKTIIYAVAQLGVVLYMFLVGAEFNVDLIRTRLKSAVTVSAAGIITPFILGGILAMFIAGNPTFFTADVKTTEAMLFVGAAISITAFPMLARIIYERGLTGTALGTLALAAGAIDDVSAWVILAIVLASFSGDPSIALIAVIGGVLYALVVLVIGRPLLSRTLGKWAEKEKRLTGPVLSFILMLVMLGAWFTDYVQIYAVFGAFIMGLAMPRGVVTRELQKHLEPVATNFLLPLFFIYSGLNTQLGLVVSPSLWGITIIILLISILGKGVACWGAARLNGETNCDAMAVGTLMNARGLMELILLNIGLERGVITPTFFTIMVIMAVVTTLMTSPLFDWIYRRWHLECAPVVAPKVLVSATSTTLE